MIDVDGLMPKGHRILVAPVEVEEVTKGGIILHTHNVQQEEMAQVQGYVVRMGNTCYADQPEAWCEVGDKVMFAKYAGIVYTGKDEKKYRIINDLDVVATMKEEK